MDEQIYDDLKILVIDKDLRTITVPEDAKIFGVSGEVRVNRLQFMAPRYCCGFDLSEFKACIDYDNANGDKNYYEVEDITTEDEYVTFTWLLDPDVTAYAGKVQFAVRMLKLDGTKVLKRFKTEPAEGEVKEGMDIDTRVLQEDQNDILASLAFIKETMSEVKKDANVQQIQKNKESIADLSKELTASKVTVDDTLKNEGEAADAKATGELIGKVAQDLSELQENTFSEIAELHTNVKNIDYAPSAGNTKALPITNYYVRDVIPENGTKDTVQLASADYGYVSLTKDAVLGTKYAGTYAKISWDKPSDLRGLWYIEGDFSSPCGDNGVLQSIADWGVQVIRLSDYGNFTDGIDLEKAVTDLANKFPNNEMYVIPFMAYVSTGHTTAMHKEVRVVQRSNIKPIVVASEIDEQVVEQVAEQAAEQVADGSVIARKAGYIIPEKVFGYQKEKSVLDATYANGVITITFNGVTNKPANDGSNLWYYLMRCIDVKDFLGQNAIITIHLKNENYSGNDNNSIHLTKLTLSNSDGSSWGTEYVGLSGLLAGNPSKISINLDDYYEKLKDKTKVRLLFGIDIRRTTANEDGTYSLPYAPTVITVDIKITTKDNTVLATEVAGFDQSEYYTKTEINEKLNQSGDYITTWGDSLTAGGGWNTRLGELAGMPVYNGGTGGENSKTIVARQGGDIMEVNGIIIPADTTSVIVASRSTDGGIITHEGNKVTPLLQGGAHVNPCKIGDVKGTLKWTGSSYSDTSGTWTFTRSEAGEEIVIDRPTAIRTDFDMNRNAPYLSVIFIGQNGGYNDLDDLVRQHRLMIEHSQAKHTIVLGLSSGSAASRAEYEARMKKEFGRYFISLREYLSHPIYNSDGEIISCYGLADQGLELNDTYTYNGTTYDALAEIKAGTVPHMILADSVHYTTGTKKVIGDMLYKKCRDLNIFK